MERAWIMVSGLCLIVAALFLWRANFDVVFVAATLGLVAWFLRIRERLRKTMIPAGDHAPDAESNGSGDEDED